MIFIILENNYPRVYKGKNAVQVRRHFLLRMNSRDQWFLLKNKKICCFQGSENHNDEIKIKARSLKVQNNFYTYPIESSILNIFISNGDLEDNWFLVSIDAVLAKLFRIILPEENNFVYVPEKHTYNSI